MGAESGIADVTRGKTGLFKPVRLADPFGNQVYLPIARERQVEK